MLRKPSPQIRAQLNEKQIDYIADFMKERIYANITLLAVLAVLWEGADHSTHLKATLSIIGATIALWLASMISTQMAYQMAHGKIMSRSKFTADSIKHAALLLSAFFPLLMVGFSAFGLIDLKSALLGAIILSILSLFAWSVRAGRSMHSSFKSILIVSSLETAVGLGIVALKIFTSH